MAYPKITVNTGLAVEVIASDTIPIPVPGLPNLTGPNSADSAGKLVAIAADFTNVSVGDIVYNTATGFAATVTAVDSTTILSLSADIFKNAPNDVYLIFMGGPNGSQRIDSSEGCLLYVGSNDASTLRVDVKVKTVAGSIVTFTSFPVGEYLPLQITQLFATGTTDVADNNCIGIW